MGLEYRSKSLEDASNKNRAPSASLAVTGEPKVVFGHPIIRVHKLTNAVGANTMYVYERTSMDGGGFLMRYLTL